jgi:hypothetical protein
MNYGRSHMAAVLYESDVYTFGGTNTPNSAPLVLSEMFDPDQNIWEILPNLPTASFLNNAVCVG